MGKFDHCLLVSDMDGTLFADPQTIPQNNIDAIQYFIENGGRFTIATGRSPMSVRTYMDQLPINCPIISTNGAQIYDATINNRLYFCECNNNLKQAAIRAQQKFPHISCFISCGNVMYSPAVCAYHDIAERIECMKSTIIERLEDIRDPWNKVLFFGDPDDVRSLYDYIKQMNDESFDVVMSADYITEILPKNVNKGTALTKLCSILNIPVSQVYAIGDYYNDLQMLTVAGCSAAPKNAPQDIRDLVDHVCCDHREGAVADYIRYIEQSLKKG